MDSNTSIQSIKDKLRKFRDERDWAQFHNPKDLAEAISVEASELLEVVLWMNKDDVQNKILNDAEYRKEYEDELADVIIFCLNASNALGIDVSEIVLRKIEEAGKRYTPEKSKGVATKYTKL